MRSSFRSVRFAAVTGVLALAFSLAACGGDGGGAEASRLGVQSGTTGEMYARDNAPEDAEIVSFDNPGDLFVALESGDIQGVLQDLVVNQGRTQEDDTVEVVETYETDEQYGFALPEEGSDELLAAMNQALGSLMADGTYAEVYQQFFDTEPAEEFTAGDAEAPEANGFDLVNEGALTVCTDAPYRPMEYEEDGEYTGFDIELMRAIAETLGLDLEVVNSGFDPITSGQAFAAGQCDVAAASITITEEREENINFTDPYFNADQSLLVEGDSGVDSLEDFGS